MGILYFSKKSYFAQAKKNNFFYLITMGHTHMTATIQTSTTYKARNSSRLIMYNQQSQVKLPHTTGN